MGNKAKADCCLTFRAPKTKRDSVEALSRLTGKNRSAVLRSLIPDIKEAPTIEQDRQPENNI